MNGGATLKGGLDNRPPAIDPAVARLIRVASVVVKNADWIADDRVFAARILDELAVALAEVKAAAEPVKETQS